MITIPKRCLEKLTKGFSSFFVVFCDQVFQVLGAAQSSGRLQSLSSAVAMAGLGHWRRFWGDAGAASSALGGSSADAVDSPALDWMVSSLADQE